MKRENVCGWHWSTPLIVLLVGVFLVGCSGNSQTTAPDLENPVNSSGTELGMFRNLLWTNPPAPDELIPDPPPGGEKNVDITNVVYDHFYQAGYPGRIKDDWPGGDLYPEEDSYTYTVAVWQVPDGEISNIWFRVLYRDGDGNYNKGIEKMVANPHGLVHLWPAVTAHLRFDGRIVIDIAFHARPGLGAFFAIWHTRYIQVTPQNFNSFNPGPGYHLGPMLVYSDPHTNCRRPDIVFDAAPDNPMYPTNRLHLVFEINGGYQLASQIYYIKGIDMFDAPVWWTERGPLSLNSPAPYNERPRIDVGYDDSEVTWELFGVSMYYVGIVWNTIEFDGEISKANVLYCGIWAELFLPTPLNVWPIPLTDAGNNAYNVYPHIEIDPVELFLEESPRFTHVVWTEASDAGPPPDYDTAIIYGVYSGRIMAHGILSSVPLYEGVEGRNGLPTFATFPRKVWDEQQGWWERKGFLTWLNDDGPDEALVEVWVGAMEYNVDPPFMYWNVGEEDIAIGDSSIYFPLVYGPEVAIFNDTLFDEILGRCIWTDFDAGNPNTVLGDCSEW